MFCCWPYELEAIHNPLCLLGIFVFSFCFVSESVGPPELALHKARTLFEKEKNKNLSRISKIYPQRGASTKNTPPLLLRYSSASVAVFTLLSLSRTSFWSTQGEYLVNSFQTTSPTTTKYLKGKSPTVPAVSAVPAHLQPSQLQLEVWGQVPENGTEKPGQKCGETTGR